MTWKQNVEQLQFEASRMSVGESRRNIVCPWCLHDENGSIIFKSENGTFFKCYHASCPVSDRSICIDGTPSSSAGPAGRENKRKPKHYLHPTGELLREDLRLLEQKTGLSWSRQRELGILKNTAWNTYVFPIRNEYGRKIGIVDRSYDGRKPKALVYMHNSGTAHLHYSQLFIDGPVVVVEDWPSAERVGEYIKSAALVGTHLSRKEVIELTKQTDTVYLWLDDDVWYPPKRNQQAWAPLPLRYQRKYGVMFKHFNFIRTPRDPKNMSDDEIKLALRQAGAIGGNE